MTAALLLLAGCERSPAVNDTPGGRLEAAAMARGLIADPATVGIAGSWSSDTDRLCVVPQGGSYRIGASVDYGDGQACAASGVVDRHGDRLRVQFGTCRFDASFDGERIVFPAVLPGACEHFCAGRASLAALAAERLSAAPSEAATLRGANGRLLCAN